MAVSWANSQCAPTDNGKPCAEQTRDSCPGRCTFDFASQNCRDTECQDYGERLDGEAACGSDKRCTYDSDLFRCLVKGEPVTCDIRFTQDLCDKDAKCTWFPDASFCSVSLCPLAVALGVLRWARSHAMGKRLLCPRL